MKPTPPEIWYGLQPEPYLPAVNVSGSGDLGKFGARSLPADRGGEGHRSSGVPVVVAHPALHVVGIFVPALRDEVEPLVCRVEHVDAARTSSTCGRSRRSRPCRRRSLPRGLTRRAPS